MKYFKRAKIGLCLLLALVSITLLFCGCGEQKKQESSEDPATNRIESVLAKPSKKGRMKDTLEIKVSLTETFCDETVSADRIRLFELTSDMDVVTDVTQLSWVAESKVRETVKFSVPLYDGSRSRLYSRFLTALYDSDEQTYTIITAARGVSNPDVYAPKQAPTVDTRASIKGLHLLDGMTVPDVQDVHPSHVMVEVPMECLLLGGWQDGAEMYVHNGVSYYVRKDALDLLDQQIKAYSDVGMTVYLRFTLTTPQHDLSELPANLYAVHPSADSSADYAVNMSDAAIARQMEGFFRFMAERYTDPNAAHGTATRFILGTGVNQSDNHFVHGWTFEAFVANYQRLVRVADTALRTYCPDGRVYISLDSNWNRSSTGNNWKAQTFLSAFATEASAQGDYPWQVAASVYVPSDAIWTTDGIDDETSTYLTVNNLSALTDMLETSRYLYQGQYTRRVLLTDLSIPCDGSAASQERQAASYAYAYCKVVENGLCDALFYRADVLTNPEQTIYQAYRRMDTNQNQAVADLADRIIGSSFSRLYQTVSSNVQTVIKTKGDVVSKSTLDLPRSAVALCEFNDINGLCGLTSAAHVRQMSLHADDTLGHSLLYTVFERTNPDQPMGISATFDASLLKGVKELSTPLYVGSQTSQVSYVTLRLTRLADDMSAPVVIYETTCAGVSGQNWQTLTFSIANFTSHLEKNDQVQLELLVDSPDMLSTDMGLGGIYTNQRATQSALDTILSILAIIAIIGGLAVLVMFLWKRKRA